MLPLERLKSLLDYDPETGYFRWRHGAGMGRSPNRIAGSWSGPGYWGIIIDGQMYYAHQLAWFYVYGEWAPQLDHEDRDKINNKIKNLRKTTYALNQMNTGLSRRNTSGTRGVALFRGNRWRARLGEQHLGLFKTREEALAAYEEAVTAKFGNITQTKGNENGIVSGHSEQTICHYRSA